MFDSGKKKGQVEVSFNWIFVLIAGAAILFFFIRVINVEMGEGERGNIERITSRLNALISALQQNPNSVSVQDRIGYEIEFSCGIDGHFFGVPNSNSRRQLHHQILFTPSIIGDSRMVAWVRTYSMPFAIGSVLYLTDEKTQYVFLKDQDHDMKEVERIYNLFPENISKILTDLNEFKQDTHEGYRKHILIINDAAAGENFGFGNDARNIAQRIDYVVAIDKTNNKIKFYELKADLNYLDTDNVHKKDYIIDEEIIGAIITGNPSLYDCAIEKALYQVVNAAQINLKRINLLQEAYPETHSCRGFYSAATTQIFTKLKETKPSNPEYQKLKEAVESIKNLNNQIIRSGTCAHIY